MILGERKSRTARLMAHQPVCTYCGVSPSTSRDHCPPIAIFDGAHRPPNLEFGACSECHEGTRGIDKVVAVISRIFPDPTTEQGRTDVRHHMGALFAWKPAFARSMFSIGDQETNYRGAQAHQMRMGANSPLHPVMDAFAARVGLALYREASGRAAGPQAGVAAHWLSNAQLDENAAVNEMLEQLGLPRSLRQGAWHVAEQFRYWTALADDGEAPFACFAAFREAFGIVAFVAPDHHQLEGRGELFRPGFLKSFEIAA